MKRFIGLLLLLGLASLPAGAVIETYEFSSEELELPEEKRFGITSSLSYCDVG